MGVLVLIGANMLLRSLDIPSGTPTADGELLRQRLREAMFFVALLVASLILATGAFATALARLGERARGDARREGLTGCYNRRAYYEFFKRESERSRRLGQGISVVLLDVDHFKSINDRHGHEVGDEVLPQFAGRVREAMRDTDLLFRWGGEEFVVLLPHTGPAEARPMAERIRATVAGRPFQGRGTHPPLSITVSIGIAGSIDHQESADAMIARADAACYRAKGQGRDRIASSDPAGMNGA